MFILNYTYFSIFQVYFYFGVKTRNITEWQILFFLWANRRRQNTVYINEFGIVGELIDNMEFTIESTVCFIICKLCAMHLL